MARLFLLSATLASVSATAYDAIAGYVPFTDVIEHNEIDLDQRDIESELSDSPKDWAGGKAIYKNGLNSVKSSGSMRKIADMPGTSREGEPEWEKMVAYYGDNNFADKWVTGALDGTNVDFTTNGDADFGAYADGNTRQQATKKGTVYLNILGYALHELESAKGKCTNEEHLTASGSNYKSMHAWDEAVAFWTGSLEGTTAATTASPASGKLMYKLAQSRASNFGVLGSDGLAPVNKQLFFDFELGKAKIMAGQCGGIQGVIDRIYKHAFIPLIQGTLKYAYSMSEWTDEAGSGDDNTYLKYGAEGAVFAAGMLGRLNNCSTTAASTVYNAVKIGATPPTFATVLAALEGQYSCLGVTCAQIGAYPTSATDRCTDTHADIAGYSPVTDVVQHNLIDEDQAALETFLALSPANFTHAKAVYNTGGYSVKGSGVARTISGMPGTSREGEPEWDKMVAYYGDNDFADKWVSGALAGTNVDYTTNGDADFSAVNDDATRVQAVKKGTVYLNIWGYALHELESAKGKCVVGGSAADNDNSAHAWDEAVAFYAGSREGTTLTAGSGKLMMKLASSRGSNFGTGEAVNTAVMAAFDAGRDAIVGGTCGSALQDQIDIVIAKGFIPIVQGVLKYAYTMSGETTADADYLKHAAEAAVFAAAVLPRIHACDAAAATTVYDNVKIGATSTDWAAVKTAIESTYTCMGITCADIGVYSDSDSVGACGGDAASSSSGLSTGALIGIIAGGVVGVGGVAAVAMKFLKKPPGKVGSGSGGSGPISA